MNLDKVQQLQVLVLEQLLIQLQNPETCTPGMLQAALRFLADNKLESLPTPGAGLPDAESLPFPKAKVK